MWLCPIKPSKREIFAPNYIGSEVIINVGVWGAMPDNNNDYIFQNKTFERYVQKLNGRKVLYSQTFYDSNQFWSIYDKRAYFELRNKYFASTTFPDVYEKVHVNKLYKVSYSKGWLKLLFQPIKKQG